MQPSTETRSFEAETKQLLDLMIHSLYTDKEIFLRELISNASDALDKLRFRSLTEPGLMPEGAELEIRLDPDTDKRLLRIHDNGIGMSRQDVIDNIGSIARSGTQEMLDRLSKRDGDEAVPELIGRFGVGFYSSFMVSDRVELQTRKAGEDTATQWSSEADGTYTISECAKSTPGTTITLHLKAADSDAGIEDYTDEWVLQNIVKRYSNFIGYPIRHRVRREQKDTDEKGIVKPDGETTVTFDDKTLNSMKPIWTRPESEVKDEEYNEFFRHIASAWKDPMLHMRFKAEGISEYESVLFVPAEPPHDLYVAGAEYGLQLYARRVMIMDRCDAALPHFLRFVRGVVDSSDIPLNISRQALQENRHVERICKFLTRKLLDKFAELQSDDEEQYLAFWKQFGRALKEGVVTEFDQRDRITKLLLFESSADPEKLTTLAGYVERMQDGQEEIYYLTGESRSIVESSPLLEGLAEHGIEVLFLTDPVDEFVVDRLPEFDDKKLKSAAKGEFKVKSDKDDESEAKTERKTQKERFGDLFSVLAKHLEEDVKRVELSSRLTTSPACLTFDEGDSSPQMERMMRSMGMPGADAPKQKRVLEVNGKHEVVKRLQDRFENNKTDPALQDFAELLFGYAMLAEGSEMKDPARFTKALEEIMVRAV